MLQELPLAGLSAEQRRHREAAARLLPVPWKKGRLGMHLNQMHSHHIEWTSRSYAAKHWSSATMLVVGLAGLIHLSLIREHFAEQFVYGLVFTALAVFQLTLALLLAVRPGPAVYRVGIWGSGLIVLIYIVTRLVPLPGASAPEELPVLSARRRNRARLCSSLDTMQEGGSRDHARCGGRMVRHPADSVLRTAAAAAPLLWETPGRWTEKLDALATTAV